MKGKKTMLAMAVGCVFALFNSLCFAAASLEPLTSVIRLSPLTERLLKTLVEATFRSKTEKEKSVAVLKKYMKGTPDDILEETYQYSKDVAEEVPMPSLEIVKAALEILSYQYPQAKATDPNPIIDTSIMKRIEQSGFIKTIYKK